MPDFHRIHPLLACVLLAAALAPADLRAAVIHVPGDRPNIATGLLVAEPGDSVVVACGTYFEHDLLLEGGVALLGETGDPNCVTIDAQGAGRVMFGYNQPLTIHIAGLTLRGGDHDIGGGAYFENSTVLFEDCIVEGNSAETFGGGIDCQESEIEINRCVFRDNFSATDGGAMIISLTRLEMRDCLFQENSADYGAAMIISGAGSHMIEDCRFLGNEALVGGGAVVTMLGNTPLFEYCLFEGNTALEGGAFYCLLSGHARLRNCTLVENRGSFGGGVFALVATPQLTNCIIAFSSEGSAGHCANGGGISLNCCDLFGNAGGDWTGCIAGQKGVNGNFSADPEFCLEENPDKPLSLRSNSPCAAANNPECGMIGALPVGCATTRTLEVTWSRVKSLYRPERR